MDGERQRDLLPLPLLEHEYADAMALQAGRGHRSVGAHRRLVRRTENISMANEVIEAINSMAGFASPKEGAPTSNQQHSMSSILGHVSSLPRSEVCMSTREAVRELLQCNPFSPYDTGDGSGTTVRPYKKELVSLPEVGASVLDASELVDDTGRRILEAYQHSMLREDELLEDPKGVNSYMDEELRNSPSLYHEFVASLHERNMLDFSHTCHSICTPFFVAKKDHRLRLVLDCRRSNSLFVSPPEMAMPAGYSFSQVQMGPEDQLYVAQSDIRDYFYSIGMPEELRSYFCLPQVDLRLVAPEHPLCLCSVGAVLIYPVMKVVPMGWNWAMYLAQRIHTYQSMLAAQVGVDRVVVDSRPVPKLNQDIPFLLVPYADNLNILGIDKQAVQQAKDQIVSHLQQLGFRTHEEQDSELNAEALGFLLDGRSGRVLPRPRKRDRTRKVLLWLAKQPKVSGRMLERVIGHCIHFFMLRRECLSIFRSVYDFKQRHYEQRVTLWKSAALECQQAAALLLMCYSDLKREWHSEVTCSDASLSGTGVCAGVFPTDDILRVGSQRELWRYRTRDAAHNAREHFSKLDPFQHLGTVKKLEEESPWDEFQINEEFQEVPAIFLDNTRWKTLFACRMTMAEHITLLEGRAVVQTLRHKSRALHNFHKRHLHFGDNLGMTLCLDRGRAKNKQLLFQCRRVAAYSIACDIEVHHRWIPSEFNAADRPSRRFESNEEPISKRQKKQFVQAILYPERSKDKERQKAEKTMLECYRSIEADENPIPWTDKTAQTCRDQAEHSRSVGSGTLEQEEVLDRELLRKAANPTANVSGTSSHLTKDSGGLPVSLASVSRVLPTEPSFHEGPPAVGHEPESLPQPVLPGWHEPQRSDKVSSCSHRCAPGSVSERVPPEGKKGTEGMEELGPRELKASDSMAYHSPSGIQDDRDGPQHSGSVCPDHVCNVLPPFRIAAASEEGSDSIQGSQHALVISPKQVRRLGAGQGRNARRMHGAEQPGDAMAGRCTGSLGIQEPIPEPVHHELSHSSGCLEVGPAKSQSAGSIHGAIPDAPQWSIVGHSKELSNCTGSETSRKMGHRKLNEEVRKTRDGDAKLLQSKPAPATGRYGSHQALAQSGAECLRPSTKPVTAKVCLELFSGSGRLARKLQLQGFTVEKWDINISPKCDLLNRHNVEDIIDGIKCGKIFYVHIGLPCQSWSRARRADGRGPGPLRDDGQFLMGLPNLSDKDRLKVTQGNRLMYNSVRILRACIQSDVLWSLENPMTSRVWKAKAVKGIAKHGIFHRADFCQYGCSWRKATYFLCTPRLPLSLKQCTGPKGFCSRTQGKHTVLQGVDQHGTFMTKVAEPYPYSLAYHIASHVKQQHSA